jgi:hypothetical protein
VWQIELLDNQLARAGTSREEVVGLLGDAGYELATFTVDAGLRPLDPGVRPQGNVWAVHRSALGAVEERLAERT